MLDPLFTMTCMGPPVPKGRPRFRIIKPRGRPQFVTVYTDAATAAYEKQLARIATEAMLGGKPLDGALSVLVEAFLPIPGSWSGRKQYQASAGQIMPMGRPDADNFGKAALDACNKIVWNDDGQIVSLQIVKTYALEPRLRLSVWAWDDVEPEQPDMILEDV